MKIKFEITNVPEAEQKKYPTAYLEGLLMININGNLFFKQPSILLIELAIFAKWWLKNIKNDIIIDFSFDTMDNDQPILSFICVEDEFFRIYSVWQEYEELNLVHYEQIVDAFEEYYEELDSKLKSLTGIDLEKIVSEAEI